MSDERHEARLLGTGTWVQTKLPDGREVRGTVVAGRFGEFYFGTREVVTMTDGHIFLWCGVIPHAEQTIEVALESRAPSALLDHLKAFVEHLDQRLGRRVVVRQDDALVIWCRRRTSWLWRAWDAIATLFGRQASVVSLE